MGWKPMPLLHNLAMKWQYMVLHVKSGMLECDDPLQMGPAGGTVGSDNLNAALNKLGGESWEVCASSFDNKGNFEQVLLKKQA